MGFSVRSVIVLGAGMAGVGPALHLGERGWNVALVERQAPSLGTSYGNAGIIQNEAVALCLPRDYSALLAIMTGRSNDGHYSLCALSPSPRNPPPGLVAFRPHATRPSRASYAGLIAHAAADADETIEADAAVVALGPWSPQVLRPFRV